MSEWADISTAPKDGTRIIAAKIDYIHDTKGHEPSSEEWRRIVFETKPTIYHVWWATTAMWSALYRVDAPPCWTDGMDKLDKPTHWIPLPTPPSAREAS